VRQFAALRLLLGDPIIPTGIVHSVTLTDGLQHSAKEDVAKWTFLISVHKLNVNGKIPFQLQLILN
jgi:hypothetical protein